MGSELISVTQYCGEEGPECMLEAAVVCSNPFNLEISSKFLQASLIGREIYLRYMASKYAVPTRSGSLEESVDQSPLACMKSLMHVHRKELKKFTNLDASTAEKIRYLNEFDREVQ